MNSDNLFSFSNRLNKNVGEVKENLRLLSGAPPSAFCLEGYFLYLKRRRECGIMNLINLN